MNETHKENGITALCSLKSHPVKLEGENYCLTKESNVKWYLKTSENGCINQISSPSKYCLSTAKSSNKLSLIPNGKFQCQNSGFDIKKLYPELSSKLGLTHSSIEKQSKVQCNKNTKTNNKIILSNRPNQDIYNMCCEKDKKGNVCQAVYICDSANNVKNKVLDNSEIKDEKNSPLKNKKNNFRVKATKDSKNIFEQNKLKKNEEFLKFKSENSYSGSKLNVQSKQTDSQLKNKSESIIKIFPHGVSTDLAMPKDTKFPSSIRVSATHQKDYYAYKSDLFPLGFESSECDTSDDESLNYFPSYEYIKDDIETNILNNRASLGELCRQQVKCRRDRMKVYEMAMGHRWALMRSHLQAARDSKAQSSSSSHIESHSVLHRKVSENQSSLLEGSICVYSDEEDKVCKNMSLPGSRHCLRHITYNVDQQLFSQCAAKREDNTLCRIPTFDIIHDPPLCKDHVDYTFVNEPSSQDTVEKAKRPKKKSKMPILSRGKRSKKRRHSFESSIIPSTRVRPPMNSPRNCFASAVSSFTTNLFADENVDTELENELKDITEEEAASHILDSKDFQEVLNKLPDSYLSQIFYATDNRNLTPDYDDRKDKLSGGLPKLKDCEPCLASTESDLNDANKQIDSIISLNQHELNAISQVLSSVVNDHTLNLESFGAVVDVVGKEDVDPTNHPSFLEVSTSSASYSEDSNSESSKGAHKILCQTVSSVTQDCVSHCTPVNHQSPNLPVAPPPTLQPL